MQSNEKIFVNERKERKKERKKKKKSWNTLAKLGRRICKPVVFHAAMLALMSAPCGFYAARRLNNENGSTEIL